MKTFDILRAINYDAPYAFASIRGDTVSGSLFVYAYGQGSVLVVEAEGLPTIECGQGIHAVYIHEGPDCENTNGQLYSGAGPVLNFTTCNRPYRTGDTPPLFSTVDGNAWYMMYTDKYIPAQLVGRTISIHQGPNEFLEATTNTTDPRIACGQIVQLYE